MSTKCDLNTHLKTVRGKHGGTFGGRYVAYEFVGHIDPALRGQENPDTYKGWRAKHVVSGSGSLSHRW